MEKTRRAFAAMLLPAMAMVAACVTPEVVDPPMHSINGTSCTRTRAINAKEVAGSQMADQTLSLTFDDGPSEVTAELSKYLAEQGIKATFFINGAYVNGREDVLEQTIADGHLLANHTHTHPALTTLDTHDILKEVAETDAILSKYVPKDKLYFRPPYGDWNELVMKTLSESEMNKYHGPVGWDIGDQLTDSTAADWDCWDEQNGTRTVEECGDLYIKEIEAKKRGVVLLHDGPPGGNGQKTLEMVRYIVPRLKAAGYGFARIDEIELRPLGAPRSSVASAPVDDPCAD